MPERLTLFADVILPLGVPNLYTYRVPYEMNALAKPGQRVVVQFGKTKFYMALVKRVHQEAPQGRSAKYIEDFLDTEPVVNDLQLKFWDWLNAYYLCSPGDVMNAALPAGLKFGSETKIEKNEDLHLEELDENYFSPREWVLMTLLHDKNEITLGEAMSALGIKNVQPVIQSLINKGAVRVREDIKESYKPRMEPFVRMSPSVSGDSLNVLMQGLEKKAYKQLQTLLAFMTLSGWHTGKPQDVKKSKLLLQPDVSAQSLTQLVKKGALEIIETEVSRLPRYHDAVQKANELTPAQQEALEQISGLYKTKDTVLLHGVTSSGKTELYMRLIAQVLEQNRQALYLLPEIALTAQLVQRLRKRWGDKVGVYHSKYSDSERVEIWKSMQQGGGYSIIVGARSALFLPFERLGLIIVDEEHDGSYKQHDPAPRYHARDSAIYLARLHGAKVMLGSATPSLESFYNAQTGKYGLVTMTSRYGGMEMPEVDVCNVAEEKRKKLMKSLFSPYLLKHIGEALAKKEQVILFRNRRGFAPFMECNICAHVPQCTHCDVSLTYHKKAGLLRCHYCGYTTTPPKTCPACGSPNIQVKGFGTEKVEEELQLLFPDAAVERMDLDSTRAKHAHARIISRFEDGSIDILVGTQMVTKGLDFDNVSVVGILDADTALHFPDFRSPEKSYQLMAQVSGRAGRKNKRGRVIIQTNDPAHPVIRQVVNNDYAGMYAEQIEERRKFLYPPFSRLIDLTLSLKSHEELDALAPELAAALKKKFGADRVLGPEYPPVQRVNNLYLMKILIKIEKEKNIARVKEMLTSTLNDFYRKGNEYARIRVKIDVDPQ
jgi:primosomal protein N' (replication factor Y)